MTEIDFNKLLQDARQAAAPLPIGDYDMVVTDAQYVTSTTNRPMYKVKLKVETGQYAGRALTNNFVVTLDNPQALRIFFRHMACFGLDENFFAPNPNPSLVSQALLNRRARVTLGMRKYRGEDQNDITAINPPSVGAVLGSNAPVTPLGQQPQYAPPPQPPMQPQPIMQPSPPMPPQPMPPQPMQPPMQPAPQPIPPAPMPPQPMQPPMQQVAQPQYAPQPPPPAQPMQAPPPIQPPPGWILQSDGSIVPDPNHQQQPQPQATITSPDENSQNTPAPAPPLPFG